MKKYKKVTKEMKEVMKELKSKKFTNKKIGSILGIAESTVLYHISEDYRRKGIARSLKNQNPRDKKEYNKKYHYERYNNDEEFRERVRTISRNSWRRRNGKGDNIS